MRPRIDLAASGLLDHLRISGTHPVNGCRLDNVIVPFHDRDGYRLSSRLPVAARREGYPRGGGLEAVRRLAAFSPLRNRILLSDRMTT